LVPIRGDTSIQRKKITAAKITYDMKMKTFGKNKLKGIKELFGKDEKSCVKSNNLNLLL